MTEDVGCPPLVDPAVLARLRAELHPDIHVYDRFIRDYTALLPDRIDRLHRAMQSMDRDAAMDAVLSLKTSSQMVGAARIASLATELESTLSPAPGSAPGPAEADPASLSLLTRIDDSAAATISVLTAKISGSSA